MGYATFNQDYKWLKESYFFSYFKDGFVKEFSNFMVTQSHKLKEARRVELLKEFNSLDFEKAYLKECFYSFRFDVKCIREDRSKRSVVLRAVGNDYVDRGKRSCRRALDTFIKISDFENTMHDGS